ncbi:MAG: Uma2 family endonuclease [Planctomycetes bacterium]|nr:Uma2 family endonuclease [Planctomycetota bacterium]
MATVAQDVPPLAAGDNLTRDEFMRRWEAHPEIKRSELIGGVVYTSFPVSVEHADREGDVGGWLFVYKTATPGCATGHGSTTFFGDDVVQADVNLRILREYGGKSWVEGSYLHGAPELFTEISRSSSAYDLHQKLEVYREAGVQEYVAFLLYERQVRWHILVNGEYELLQPDVAGVYRSRVFPGVWLDGPAFWAGDTQAVITRLHEGIATPEHQEFVARLASQKRA